MPESGTRDSAFVSLVPILTRQSLADIMALVGGLPQGSYARMNGFDRIVRTLVEDDPEMGTQFAMALDSSPPTVAGAPTDQIIGVMAAFRQLAKSGNPDWTVAWLEKQPSGPMRTEAIKAYQGTKPAPILSARQQERLKLLLQNDDASAAR